MATGTEVSLEYLESPIKSENDQSVYRFLQLPNGLNVLLISETGELPESSPIEDDENVATLSVLVNVGSFSDPPEYQGLAHFVEHLVSMGSSKYPAENAFKDHIMYRGGNYNAVTTAEDTIFTMIVPEEQLDCCMDCFSAIFKAPLLRKESAIHVCDAIEMEFQKIINNDAIRFIFLLASLAAEGYPQGKFGWGNLQSLWKKTNNNENAHNRLYEAAYKFYRRYYCANRMYICMESRLPLPEMENLIVKHFADMRTNRMDTMDISDFNYRNAFADDFHQKLFLMKPVRNLCLLEFNWVMPPSIKYYKCKPASFLGELLQYAGKGGLLYYLRRKGWAFDVTAGIPEAGFSDNSIYSLFHLCVILTKDGFQHLDEVVKATFTYIKLFVKPESAATLKLLYEETQKIQSTNFRYKPSEITHLSHLVSMFRKYPVKDILTGSSLYFEYDQSQIREIIDILSEFKFNIMLVSQLPYKGIGTRYDKREEWFGTEYTTLPVPEHWIRMWKESQSMEELYLPLPNPFIAHDFSIRCKELGMSNVPLYPVNVFQNDVCELWFKMDDKFLLPEVCVHFNFISPLLKQSAKNAVLSLLYINFLYYHVGVKLYPAAVAGFNFHFNVYNNGIEVYIYGFNEKLSLMVEELIKTMISLKDLITLEELNFYRLRTKDNIYNAMNNPESLNTDICLNVATNIYWNILAKYKALDTLTVEEMKWFATNFPNELYIQCLMQGNLRESEAIDIMKSTLQLLNCNRIVDIEKISNRALQIPSGYHLIRCSNMNKRDRNTYTTNYYQIGPLTVKLDAMLRLLVMFMQEPLYETLCTLEQVGYNVSVNSYQNYGILGYTITLNSLEDQRSANYVNDRIEEFRIHMLSVLEEISEETFDVMRDSCIQLLQIEPNSLMSECERNWAEIEDCVYLFDRSARLTEVLRAVTKEDIIDLYWDSLLGEVCKLTIQVIGNPMHLRLVLDNGMTMYTINDLIEIFKNCLQFGPVFKVKGAKRVQPQQ